MTIIPIKNETLVSTLSSEEILLRLRRVTVAATTRKLGGAGVFQGTITEDGFRISQKLNQPNNFVPLIEGKIDHTKHGCLIFLRYKLFFSSVMFFIFWTFIAVLLAIFIMISGDGYLYASLTLLAGGINYVIVILNFRKQVKISRELLLEAINIA